METEKTRYISYPEAVYIHIKLMRKLGETRYGVFNRELIESALARPQHAATYDNADLLQQAASLCFGLIKNHPWEGGNKRTATVLVNVFLKMNGYRLVANKEEVIAMVLAVEAGKWSVDEIGRWIKEHATAG